MSNYNIPFLLVYDYCQVLFLIGLCGVIWNRQNFLVMLISLELVFVSISLYFAFFSVFLGDITAQKYSILIIAVAAAETAVGCSLLIVSYKLGRKVSYASLKCLKG